MKHLSHQSRWYVSLGVSSGLILLGLLFGLAWPVSIQAGPTLPPRNPSATPQPHKDKDKARPVGAYIVLQASGQTGNWSVVQWQDSAGGWQNVEGWQGPLPDNTQWWVAAKDFGKGPFHWAVTQGPGGSLLGTSQIFNLPAQPNETLRVSVLLSP